MLLSRHTRRREFITLFGGAAAAWPLAARAQQGERVRRIGVMVGQAEDDPNSKATLGAFRQGTQAFAAATSSSARARGSTPQDPTTMIWTTTNAIISQITPGRP